MVGDGRRAEKRGGRVGVGGGWVGEVSVSGAWWSPIRSRATARRRERLSAEVANALPRGR